MSGGRHAWAVWAYRASLIAFPVDVRRAHGEEMASAFAHLLRAREIQRPVGVIRFLARGIADSVAEGVRERARRATGTDGRRPVRSRAVTGNDEEGMMWSDLKDDVLFTLRGFGRSSGANLVLILTLALGIGASTAVFSVLQGVLLRPLPYEEPGELITVRHEVTAIPNAGLQGIPGPDLLDYIDGTPSIEHLGSVFTLETNLNDDRGAARVTIGWVTPDFFDVLGVHAAAGRMLQRSDWTPRTRAQMEDPTFAPPPMPVMLSHELWSDRFGADPDLLGRSVTINGTQMTVLGIMPVGFKVFAPADASISPRIDAFSYMPLPMTEGQRGAGQGLAIARLSDGADVEQAVSELEQVAATLVERHERHARLGTRVVTAPLLDGVVGQARTFLWVLFGAIAVVLLIAVLNVANLLLVRARHRQQEFAVRITLGVGRGRLIRQLLTESAVLASLGATAGLAVAWVGVDVLVSFAPADLPRLDTVHIDSGVLLFTALTSSVAALMFGVAPALSSTSVDPASMLHARGGVGSGRFGVRVRQGMIVGEIALSVLLVAGAGLLLRSFGELASVEPGYEPSGAVAVELALPFFTYRGLESRQAFFQELIEEASSIPGVTAAGIAPGLPFTARGYAWNGAYGDAGSDVTRDDAARAQYRGASPGFFEALGATLVDGRAFTSTDGLAGTELAVVIDTRMAEIHWPEGVAVGGSLAVQLGAYIGPGRVTTARVVGVVEPVRYASLAEAEPPTIWVPFNETAPLEAALVLRGPGDPVAAAAEVRRILREIDPSAPVYALRRLEDDLRASTSRTRYAMLLMVVFALSALTLAAVGLYGVVASSVQRRTREIGVRIALGALRRNIGSMVLKEAARLAAVGVAAGVLGALITGPVLGTLLYQVAPSDPLTLTLSAAVLGAVALFAAWLPATRASRLDPVHAIRSE
ncbi:MAG: ABC transporter permease [Gemmatimonadota bacterium]